MGHRSCMRRWLTTAAEQPAPRRTVGIASPGPTRRAPTARRTLHPDRTPRLGMALTYQNSNERTQEFRPSLHQYNWRRPLASFGLSPPITDPMLIGTTCRNSGPSPKLPSKARFLSSVRAASRHRWQERLPEYRVCATAVLACSFLVLASESPRVPVSSWIWLGVEPRLPRY